MIFDSRSSYMLKYEKSKSKLVEFNVSKENYPNYPLDPDDLTYTTLYVLSRYCEDLIENPSSQELLELKSELTIVSQYYDSTVKTNLRKKYSKQFLLLGSTAYFLSDNFGSAKVLIEKIDDWKPKNGIMTILYATLRFLLTGMLIDLPVLNRNYSQFLDGLKNHFEHGVSPETSFDALRKMRKRIHNSNNIVAVSYVDFLFSTIIHAIKHSAWILLPRHSDSNGNEWAKYLRSGNSIKLLWPAQKVILEAGALTENDLVVPLPTGVGKTKSIELLLRAKFLKQENNLAIIIAPLRALCNEITSDLISVLSDDVIVNQFTDMTQEDFEFTILSDSKYVFICTPEKFSYILRHKQDIIESIQLFIFDEAHLFDDASRGTQYELLVSEISRSRNSNAQMVLFSAVLANANQISGWLFDDESATIDYSLVKSTEKSIGFLSSDQTIHYYEKDNMADESFFVPKSIVVEPLQSLRKGSTPKYFPEKNAQDIAIYYANKLAGQGGVAIYAGRVTSIAPIMRRIVEINKRGYDLSNLLGNESLNEVAKLSNLIALNYGENFELTGASKLGAFPHYANLANGIKMSIEHALRKKHISLVVCTTTLAEGVNIPIKYLFLTTFSLGTTSVQIRKMQNMVGRTARSGIHTEGSAIITDPTFYDNRANRKAGGQHKWEDCKKMFDFSHTEACSSAILSLASNVYVDYNSYYKAELLISYLINNYNNPECFTNLIEEVQYGYKQHVNNEDKFERYAPGIATKIKQIEHIVENIENYLCYIHNSQQSPDQFYATVHKLVHQTFAYYLGSVEQREALTKFFNLIAQKIVSNIDPEKAAYFAKSLYGIDVSNRVLIWINEYIETLEEYSTEGIIDAVLNLFVELFPDKAKIEYDTLKDILHLWISGMPYVGIQNSIRSKLKINTIEKICSNTFSFHFCFLIGNILDAISERSEYLTEQLTILQKNVKYGVPSIFQIFICENVFDDRIVAKQIDEILSQDLVTGKAFQDHIVENRRKILHTLKSYPGYFTHKFQIYTRKAARLVPDGVAPISTVHPSN